MNNGINISVDFDGDGASTSMPVGFRKCGAHDQVGCNSCKRTDKSSMCHNQRRHGAQHRKCGTSNIGTSVVIRRIAGSATSNFDNAIAHQGYNWLGFITLEYNSAALIYMKSSAKD
jgi:hypothetical protein